MPAIVLSSGNLAACSRCCDGAGHQRLIRIALQDWTTTSMPTRGMKTPPHCLPDQTCATRHHRLRLPGYPSETRPGCGQVFADAPAVADDLCGRAPPMNGVSVNIGGA
jgi:hypothetical protein